MANVFNRITMQYKKSVNTPDFPVEDWIINPKFVPDCKAKYMVVDGDNIREMTLEEKAVIDYVAPIPESEPLTINELEKIRNVTIAVEIALKYSPTDEIAFLRKLTTGESKLTDVDIMKWLEVVATAQADYPKV